MLRYCLMVPPQAVSGRRRDRQFVPCSVDQGSGEGNGLVRRFARIRRRRGLTFRIVAEDGGPRPGQAFHLSTEVAVKPQDDEVPPPFSKIPKRKALNLRPGLQSGCVMENPMQCGPAAPTKNERRSGGAVGTARPQFQYSTKRLRDARPRLWLPKKSVAGQSLDRLAVLASFPPRPLPHAMPRHRYSPRESSATWARGTRGMTGTAQNTG
jgi:hypothetical protein